MLETTNTFSCYFCGHTTDVANDFMPTLNSVGLECVSEDACKRRQKRDAILAETKRPAVHPVDRFTRLSIALCGMFMGAVVAIGASYLWLGI